MVPANAWSNLAIVSLTPEEEAFAARLPPRLGAGERSCLAVAYHRHGLFASDDLDARAPARQYEIVITGTLGILLQSMRIACLTLDQANSLLLDMIAAGYHSPLDRLDSLLDR